MTILVPANFDVRNEALDGNEQFIRDSLTLDISNWAKFRLSIHIGNNAANLYSPAAISDDIKEAYRELAKSHYEVVTSFGCARLAFDELNQQMNPLQFKKRSKDFYFHIGCLLDNLARIIFIINDPHSATVRNNRGNLIRHWVDWGSLKRYKGYKNFKRSPTLKGIINLRNNLTHSWAIPMKIDQQNGNVYWPIRVRTDRAHPWPYDEATTLNTRYRSWRLVSAMTRDDFDFITTFQSDVFRKLVCDVPAFERNNNIEIR